MIVNVPEKSSVLTGVTAKVDVGKIKNVILFWMIMTIAMMEGTVSVAMNYQNVLVGLKKLNSAEKNVIAKKTLYPKFVNFAVHKY